MATIARTITLDFLASREVLPHAANGEPIGCSDEAAKNVRKEMKGERSQEFKRIMTVALCDLRDGVPLQTVAAPIYQMLAFLEVQATAVRPMPRPILSLIRKETRRQATTDLAEMRVIEQPGCEVALSALIREGNAHIADLTEVVQTAQLHRAVVMGAR